MRVVVTGATSGLGRNAAQYLLESGHAVQATGRNRQAGAELARLGADFTALDLTRASQQELAALLNGADWVWHCAALSAPWGAKGDFYRTNTLATETLARVAGQTGVKRFVYIATPSIYFDFRDRRGIREDFCAKSFVNHYALSKFKAEQATLKAQEKFPLTLYTILRPRAIFGPHDRVLLPRIVGRVLAGQGVLRLPNAGRAFVDVTFVLNVVRAMFLASTVQGLPPGAAYNISNHEPLCLADLLLRLLRQEMGLKLRIRSLPYPLLYGLASLLEAISYCSGKEPALTRYGAGVLRYDMTLDTQKARDELGYAPLYSLEEGIRRTARWLRTT